MALDTERVGRELSRLTLRAMMAEDQAYQNGLELDNIRARWAEATRELEDDKGRLGETLDKTIAERDRAEDQVEDLRAQLEAKSAELRAANAFGASSDEELLKLQERTAKAAITYQATIQELRTAISDHHKRVMKGGPEGILDRSTKADLLLWEALGEPEREEPDCETPYDEAAREAFLDGIPAALRERIEEELPVEEPLAPWEVELLAEAGMEPLGDGEDENPDASSLGA